MGPILMSGSNPDGYKLEELLAALRAEIDAKSKRLSQDPRPEAQMIIKSNARINSMLLAAEGIQRNTMRELDKLGPDRGPRGPSRLGGGPAAYQIDKFTR